MNIKSWFLSVFAVIQSFFMMIGVLPMGEINIEYGGTPYEEKVISEPMALVENGVSDYVIVLPESASASQVTAANELQHYINEISGCTLPIIRDSADGVDTEICLGQTNRDVDSVIDYASLGDEGFELKVVDQRLFIAGSDVRGTLYGVYSFLEEYLGCRWFAAELTVVPESADIIIDKNLEDRQVPIFEYRDIFWTPAFDAAWMAKSKINSNVRGLLGEEYGGGVSYANTFAHSLTVGHLITEADFNAYPETQALGVQSGKRVKDHPCLSAEKTYEIVLASAFRWLDENPNADIISITHPDNSDYCVCDLCSAVYEEEESTAGVMIRFTNRIADAVAEEYPDRDIKVDTFAYQYTRQATKVTVPRDNVIVRLCSIECCFAHPLTDCGHLRHEPTLDTVKDIPSSFAVDIADWSEISETLYIWDYTTNFREYMLPFPNFHVLSPNMQLFANSNVKGVFEQGNYNAGNSGEFGELRSYVLAKLLWDPQADVEYHMMDFMRSYYGEDAAEYIKEYIDLITFKVSELSHSFIFTRSNELFTLSRKERVKADSLWKAALDSDISEQQRENILRSELSYRYFKGCLFLGEFSLLSPNRMKENEKLYNDIKNSGITRTTETRDLQPNPNFLLRPSDWDQH